MPSVHLQSFYFLYPVFITYHPHNDIIVLQAGFYGNKRKLALDFRTYVCYYCLTKSTQYIYEIQYGGDNMVPCKMQCPRCGKRACDISANNSIENLDFYIELKCPNCKNIVKIQYYKNISIIKKQ